MRSLELLRLPPPTFRPRCLPLLEKLAPPQLLLPSLVFALILFFCFQKNGNWLIKRLFFGTCLLADAKWTGLFIILGNLLFIWG